MHTIWVIVTWIECQVTPQQKSMHSCQKGDVRAPFLEQVYRGSNSQAGAIASNSQVKILKIVFF